MSMSGPALRAKWRHDARERVRLVREEEKRIQYEEWQDIKAGRVVWRPIPGYPKYEIHALGSVRLIGKLEQRPNVLKGNRFRVVLFKQGKGRTFDREALIQLAFPELK